MAEEMVAEVEADREPVQRRLCVLLKIAALEIYDTLIYVMRCKKAVCILKLNSYPASIN